MPELTCALGPDSAGTVLSAHLVRARTSIDAAVYEVGPSYSWAFVNAARRGLHVRLLLDAHAGDGNARTAERVMAAGGECRILGTDSSAAHWKLLIVDGDVAVGTGNLLWLDAPRDRQGRLPPLSRPLFGTREWWTITAAAQGLCEAAVDAFERAWSRAACPPARWREALTRAAPAAAVGCPSPQVAPLVTDVADGRLQLCVGAAPVADALNTLATEATAYVHATTPYAHPCVPAVAQLIARLSSARRRGLDVRLLLGERPRGDDARRLASLPFEVRSMNPRRGTRGHAKGLVTEAAVLAGSSNWSAGGLRLNLEAALMVRDPVAASYFNSALLRDWEVSDRL